MQIIKWINLIAQIILTKTEIIMNNIEKIALDKICELKE